MHYEFEACIKVVEGKKTIEIVKPKLKKSVDRKIISGKPNLTHSLNDRFWSVALNRNAQAAYNLIVFYFN